MPELPDAEVFRRRMARGALRRRIDQVHVPDERLLADVSRVCTRKHGRNVCAMRPFRGCTDR